MAYKFTLNGIEITCETVDELRAAVGPFAGHVSQIVATSNAARGSGPAKSWHMARWLVADKWKGMTTDAARTKLAELRRNSPAEYEALTKEFEDAEGAD